MSIGKLPLVLKGKYRLLSELGVGGTGAVYLAEHIGLRRKVAVKILPAGFATNSVELARFQREATALAALDHPNVVRAHDCDEHDGVYFLVMEYAEGVDLYQYVARHGPFSPDGAVTVIAQAAAGLLHAHREGWVHRDVKPNNLFLDATGRVKVLDLGLARIFSLESGDNLTGRFDSGAVMGTADYIAPEQAIDSTTVDHRADVYSLGASFYFLLTGQPPFPSGTLAQKLLAHQIREPRPIRDIRPEVPEAMARLVHRMLAKNPIHRPQSLEDVVVELRAPVSPGSPRAQLSDPVQSTLVVADSPETVLDLARRNASPVPEVAVPLVPAMPPPLSRVRGRSAGRVWWVAAAVGAAAIAGGSSVVVPADLGRPALLEMPPPTHTVPHSPPTRAVIGAEPATARTVSGGTQFDLKGSAFAKYESDSETGRPFPCVTNVQTPAGTIVVARACFSLQAIIEEENKTIQDVRGIGPIERLAEPAVGVRHKLELQKTSKSIAVGVTDMRTVRVTSVGTGRLLVMESVLIGPAGKGVKSSPLNGLVVTLAPTEGKQWMFRLWPNGTSDVSDVGWGVAGQSVIAKVGGDDNGSGVAIFVHPDNTLRTRLTTKVESAQMVFRGNLGQASPPPVNGLFGFGTAPMRMAYGLFTFDRATNGTGDIRAAYDSFLSLARE
ncbi:serine/threonine-protein kinase [Gemmata sp.]|uniref:serine/threonine-protein kinase n=1 Tax=Gemmata sp. TaxID=1914242 RepID=UPI003F7238CD